MYKMKKLKIIAASLIIALSAVSCENDGGTSNRNISSGAVPNIQKIASTDQGLNVLVLNAGGSVDMGVTVTVGEGDVASMDIIGLYTKNGVTEKGVFKKNVTTFPAEIHITENDLYTAFTTLNSPSDFDLFDKFVISADVTLKNGTIVRMFTDEGTTLFGADIANSELFKVIQTYNPACPLLDASIFSGNYKVVEDKWADYGVGDIIPVTYNAADGIFEFKILATANPYINNASTAYILVTVDPTTNTIVASSNEDFDYGGGDTTTVTGTGTVGSCNGDISLSLDFPGFSATGFNLKLAKVIP